MSRSSIFLALVRMTPRRAATFATLEAAMALASAPRKGVGQAAGPSLLFFLTSIKVLEIDLTNVWHLVSLGAAPCATLC